MSRRQITRPMSIPGADRYFRLRMTDIRSGRNGYHNQPFATWLEAAEAATTLSNRALRGGINVRVEIVEVTAR